MTATEDNKPALWMILLSTGFASVAAVHAAVIIHMVFRGWARRRGDRILGCFLGLTAVILYSIGSATEGMQGIISAAATLPYALNVSICLRLVLVLTGIFHETLYKKIGKIFRMGKKSRMLIIFNYFCIVVGFVSSLIIILVTGDYDLTTGVTASYTLFSELGLIYASSTCHSICVELSKVETSPRMIRFLKAVKISLKRLKHWVSLALLLMTIGSAAFPRTEESHPFRGIFYSCCTTCSFYLHQTAVIAFYYQSVDRISSNPVITPMKAPITTT